MGTSFFATLGVILSAVGVALLLRGFRWDPSRGRARCPRCWYALAGAASPRCPECGVETTQPSRLYRTRRSRRVMAAGVGLCLLGAAAIAARGGVQVPWRFVPTPLLLRALPYAESAAWREFLGRAPLGPGGFDAPRLAAVCERTALRNPHVSSRLAALELASVLAASGESSALRVHVIALADRDVDVVVGAGMSLLQFRDGSVNLGPILSDLLTIAGGQVDGTGDGSAAFHASVSLMTVEAMPCEFAVRVARLYEIESPATMRMVAGALSRMAGAGCDLSEAVAELDRLAAEELHPNSALARALAESLRPQ